MSIDIMNRLWWRKDLPTMEKFVGLALADAASDDGVCWPAVATIAEKCSCSERTVQNAVKGLCGKGLLRKRERTDQSSFYIFVLECLPHVERPRRTKENSPAHGRTGTGAGDSPQLFDTGESGSVTGESGSMTGAGDSPRTVIETSEESSLESTGNLPLPASPSLDDFVFSEFEALKRDHPKVAMPRKIDEQLSRMIAQRAKTFAKPGETPHDVWRLIFEQIRTSRFLTGRAAPGPGRDSSFSLSLGWLCRPAKFREVLDGKYASAADDRAYRANGDKLGPTGQAVSSTLARFSAARQRGGRAGNP